MQIEYCLGAVQRVHTVTVGSDARVSEEVPGAAQPRPPLQDQEVRPATFL